MVKGEPLEAPAGRADDFAWPRREVGRIELGKETPVASANPSAATSAQKQQKRAGSGTLRSPSSSGFFSAGQQQQQSASAQRAKTAPPRQTFFGAAWFPGFFTR
jgi:hypothetical protein